MKINKKLLRSICSIQSVSGNMQDMECFILEYLNSNNIEWDTDREGNIYINRSFKDVPCMVAHLDTVHKIEENLTVFESHDTWVAFNKENMNQIGIGGDDKVGIYITLELLKVHKMKAAFFVDEEIGCAGSMLADMKFFKDCLYVLQCDRRGNSDFVTNISGVLSSKTFQNAVKPYLKNHMYNFSNGMITDVGQLAENGIGVSVANMSCGYYDPHCRTEYIVLPDIENCMNMCSGIFLNLVEAYPYKYKREFSRGSWYDSNDNGIKALGTSTWAYGSVGSWNFKTKKYDSGIKTYKAFHKGLEWSADYKAWIDIDEMNESIEINQDYNDMY